MPSEILNPRPSARIWCGWGVLTHNAIKIAALSI
jgi:hypothetical protein